MLVVLEVLPVETTSISRCVQLSPRFPETHPFYAGKETRGSGGHSDSKIYKNISCKPMAKMRCLTSIPGWLQTTEMSSVYTLQRMENSSDRQIYLHLLIIKNLDVPQVDKESWSAEM